MRLSRCILSYILQLLQDRKDGEPLRCKGSQSLDQRFLREALIKSARADSKRFFFSRKVQKWRNTVCISRF